MRERRSDDWRRVSAEISSLHIDGIEGYVYPMGYAQPANMELLVPAYKSSVDDWAIFPQSEQSNMAASGYTRSISCLGYVYQDGGY